MCRISHSLVWADHPLQMLFLLPDNATFMTTQELKRFPSLQSEIAAAATEALEKFRDESRKTVTRLVEMESSYLTVEFFRKLHLEPEKNANSNPAGSNMDRYAENHFRKIGMQLFACIATTYSILRKLSF